MSKRRDIDYLGDMEEAMILITAYTEDLTFDEFTRDRKTQDAVVRNLEIMGEAAQNISAIPSRQLDASSCRDEPLGLSALNSVLALPLFVGVYTQVPATILAYIYHSDLIPFSARNSLSTNNQHNLKLFLRASCAYYSDDASFFDFHCASFLLEQYFLTP